MYCIPLIIDKKGDLQIGIPVNKECDEGITLYDKKGKKCINLKLETNYKGKVIPYTQYKKINVPNKFLFEIYLQLFQMINDFNPIKIKNILEKGKNNKREVVNITKNVQKLTIQTDKKTGIEYVVLKKGKKLYKGMTVTNKSIEDFDNLFACKIVWYTLDKNTADIYTNHEKDSNRKTYSFTLLRDVKLFLLSAHNIELLISKIFNKAINFIHTKTDKKMKKINEYVNLLNRLKIATGFTASYKEQKQLIEQNKIKYLGKKLKEEDHNKMNFDGKRYKVYNDIYSEEAYNLNRISLSVVLDDYLAKSICKNFNIDGYINTKVPSIWEYSRRKNDTPPLMTDELTLCIQRGVVKINNTL